VVKPGVGKYSEVLGLNHGTTSGERGVTRFLPPIPDQEGKTQQEHSQNLKFGKLQQKV
jgi:hypothetical protein